MDIKRYFQRLLYKNVDKILDSLIKKITDLDALVERELAFALADEKAAAEKLAAAGAQRASADRANRIVAKLKDLVA